MAPVTLSRLGFLSLHPTSWWLSLVSLLAIGCLCLLEITKDMKTSHPAAERLSTLQGFSVLHGAHLTIYWCLCCICLTRLLHILRLGWYGWDLQAVRRCIAPKTLRRADLGFVLLYVNIRRPYLRHHVVFSLSGHCVLILKLCYSLAGFLCLWLRFGVDFLSRQVYFMIHRFPESFYHTLQSLIFWGTWNG